MSRVDDFATMLAPVVADLPAPVEEPTPEPVVEKKAPAKKAAPKKATAPRVKKETEEELRNRIRDEVREELLKEIAEKDSGITKPGTLVNIAAVMESSLIPRVEDSAAGKPLNVELPPNLLRELAMFCAATGVRRKILVARLVEDTVRAYFADETAAEVSA